ncbi:VMAP-C domain-containing protein [Streptomyces fungicidicus]|uniref:VMAP-C domain-containing protein n=1 Tax=Streptomyces fungicidicus TaxID=68203 RepID=UPI003814B41E
MLAEELNRHVDLRGTKLREDAVALVRAALSVRSGDRVLVDVVRVFEGAAAARVFEELIGPGEIQNEVLPGPLDPQDLDAASALLRSVQGALPADALRNVFASDLHLDPPPGLSPAQLLTYATELNAQPDGLPPAVLLIDHAAELTSSSERRLALSAWASAWARRADLLTALERRRAERAAGSAADPTIPRCLVVAVEPARDGSDDIVVRPWLNTVPGRWQPRAAEPETTSLHRLGRAVERALRQVVRLSPTPHAPAEISGQTPPYVEFVLPYDLLNHDMAGLTIRSVDGRPQPLGLKYGVHLRSLERMRTDDLMVRAQWLERWETLRSRGIGVHGWRTSERTGLDAWQASLASEPSRTAAVLDAPDGGAATEAVKAAIAEGIGLAVWDRRGEFSEERREVVTAVFSAVPTPTQIPIAIHRLRRTAGLDVAGPLLLGRHIAFLWDDPHRLVDIQTAADYGFDDHDSEETPL